MKKKIKLELQLEPWMFGHFTQAAAELNCSVEKAVQAFVDSDPGGDALCEWVSFNLQPETAGNPRN